MNRKKRILILYADAGFGHRSAALAVKAGLEEKYGDQCQIEMVNPLQDERTPFYLRDSQADYDTMIRSVPELYKLGYDVSDSTVPTLVVETAMILMLYDAMNDLVKRTKPDVIVSTYPLYQAPLDAVFTMKQLNIPIVTVVTDLVNVHRAWFNIVIEKLMVPTPNVQQQATKAGLSGEKVFITGIPVSTTIAREKRSKKQIRADLGLDPDRFIILVAGSKRVDGLPEILDGLNHSGHPVELVLVAGGDEELYQCMRLVDWHLPVRIYNYVDFIPALLNASDAVICKSGGLIVSETMAAGLPMILINVLPGQESGNAEYVISNGSGEMAESSSQLLEIIAHWLENDRLVWNQRRVCSVNHGKPESAFTIADEIYQLSQIEIQPRKAGHLFERSHLASLLRKKYRLDIKLRSKQMEKDA